MALSAWWDGDNDQRYWMEVATTGSIGDVLIAPKFDGASWSYELVSHVRKGDRVLHWNGTPKLRGLVGWSVATEDPDVAPSYTWQARGTAGRVSGPRTTEGWVVRLGGLNRFDPPLTFSQLQGYRDPVLALNGSLEADRGAKYLPFYRYDDRQIRAFQGYLAKFPAELFEVLPHIGEARIGSVVGAEGQPPPTDEDEVLPEDTVPPKRPVRRGRLTRIQDPLIRSAIENHAVDAAIRHYESQGATDITKLGKPYDLSLLLNGVLRHVEVKGSSLAIETVELTINEVNHARDYQPSDLVVLDEIVWTREGSDITTSGGRLRVWSDWAPDDDDLAPKRFAYSLPSAPPSYGAGASTGG